MSNAQPKSARISVHFAPNTNMSPMESPMSEQSPALSLGRDEKRLKVLDDGILFHKKQAIMQGVVAVQNVSTEVIMFKVKTTSPEKFRVVPPAGLIKPGQIERIHINSVQGYDIVSVRDKFLIMCKPLGPEQSERDLKVEMIHSEFKATENGAEIENHRVRCIFPDSSSVGGGGAGSAGNPGDANESMGMAHMDKHGGGDLVRSPQVAQLTETIQRLERRLRQTQLIQLIMLTLCFLLIVGIAIYVPKLESLSAMLASGDYCNGPAAQNRMQNEL